MNKLLRAQLDDCGAEIERLCRQCHVMRLDLFGSAVLERFDPKHSDLDFLVAFQDGCYSLENYLGLAEGLEKILGRKVDLVIERAIRNPWFRQSVNATRRLVYDRGQQEAAA